MSGVFILLKKNLSTTLKVILFPPDFEKRYPRCNFVVMRCVCSSHQTVLPTRRHPAHPVSPLILHPREMQALWSQNYVKAVKAMLRGKSA